MNKNKKCLGIIIDTDIKIPPLTGVTYRLHYLSKAIASSGYQVKIFICNRNIFCDNDISNYYDSSDVEYHVIPEDFFYNPLKMLSLISENNIDILQYEDAMSVLRYESIATKLKIPVVLELHDIESSLKEMLDYCNSEIDQTKAITLEACNKSDEVICMTPLDKKELEEDIGFKKTISLVPNPIDGKVFPYFGSNITEKNIIFIGNMHYWPNAHAVKRIISNIIPNVLQYYPTTHFFFIGMYDEEEFGKDFKNITFTGPVDDINSYLKKATLSLCPVFEGSGMKVKILNYGSAGIPTITTTIGSSGYENIKSLVVCDQMEDYVDIIVRLFGKIDTLATTGKKFRDEIVSEFSIEKISQEITTIYDRIILGNKNKKKEIKKVDVPKPLWLSENRAKENSNKFYYIIKNEKLIKKTKLE